SLISNSREVRNRVAYYPNSSIYSIGNKYRYTEFKVTDGEKSFEISEIAKTEVLEAIVKKARRGAKIADFQVVVSSLFPGIDSTESCDFINELIDNQVIVSNIEPTVSGIFYLDHLIKELTDINKDKNETIDNLLN